jgi:hypothetical protein
LKNIDQELPASDGFLNGRRNVVFLSEEELFRATALVFTQVNHALASVATFFRGHCEDELVFLAFQEFRYFDFTELGI